MINKLTTYVLIAMLFATQAFMVNGMSCMTMYISPSFPAQGVSQHVAPISNVSNVSNESVIQKTTSNKNVDAKVVTKEGTSNHAASDKHHPCNMSLGADKHADTSSSMSMECCEQDETQSCSCPVSACGAMALASNLTNLAQPSSYDKIITRGQSIPEPFYQQSHRPPINA